MHFSLPTLLVLLPAAGGLVSMAMVSRRAAGIVSLITFAAQAALAVVGGLSLAGHGVSHLELVDKRQWFDLWNISWFVQLDQVALGLIALVTLVTFCASVFAWHAGRTRPGPFHGLLWLSAASMCGLFMARDLVLFYVFFELMLVPLLFLVGGWGGAMRIRAALTMFIYTLVGSLLMLVGIIGVGVQAHTFSLVSTVSHGVTDRGLADLGIHYPWWVFATFAVAFAVKAPLMPFHGWLPITYRQAPAEVTAVLSGLVSKAAMVGFLLVLLPLFPDYMSGSWGQVVTWVALVGLLYGSIAAFRQVDARGVVAYSSLAQMGLIVLGLSVYLGAGGAQAVGGAYLQAINHGLLSASLFLLIGVVELRAGTGLLARLGGLATGRPVLATIALVVTMCALAVPGSNAFAGELLVLLGTYRGQWTYSWLLAALGGAAIVLAAMYALRLLSALLHTPGGPAPGEQTQHGAPAVGHEPPLAEHASPAAQRFGDDLRRAELVVLLPLVGAILLLSAWPNAAKSAMNQRAVPVPAPGTNAVQLQSTGAQPAPKLAAASTTAGGRR